MICDVNIPVKLSKNNIESSQKYKISVNIINSLSPDDYVYFSFCNNDGNFIKKIKILDEKGNTVDISSNCFYCDKSKKNIASKEVFKVKKKNIKHKNEEFIFKFKDIEGFDNKEYENYIIIIPERYVSKVNRLGFEEGPKAEDFEKYVIKAIQLLNGEKIQFDDKFEKMYIPQIYEILLNGKNEFKNFKELEQFGRKKSIQPSEKWKIYFCEATNLKSNKYNNCDNNLKYNGRIDTTPKTDILVNNGEYRISFKKGANQIMSGKDMETYATLVAALEKIYNENLRNEIDNIIKKFENLKFTDNLKNITTIKKLIKNGYDKKDFSKEEIELIEKVLNLDKIHKELTKKINELLKNDKFKYYVIQEAMTGFTKFGEDSLAAANYMLYLDLDNMKHYFENISGDNNKYINKVANRVKFDISFKTSGNSGWTAFKIIDSKKNEGLFKESYYNVLNEKLNNQYNILKNLIYESFEEFNNDFNEGLNDLFNKGKEKLKNIISKIIDFFKSLFNKIKNFILKNISNLLAFFGISLNIKNDIEFSII